MSYTVILGSLSGLDRVITVNHNAQGSFGKNRITWLWMIVQTPHPHPSSLQIRTFLVSKYFYSAWVADATR